MLQWKTQEDTGLDMTTDYNDGINEVHLHSWHLRVADIIGTLRSKKGVYTFLTL